MKDYFIRCTQSDKPELYRLAEALGQVRYNPETQTWSYSVYSKLVAGSLAPLSASFLYVVGTDGATQTETAATITYAPTSASLRTQRFTGTGTLANAGTTHIVNTSILRIPNGATVDFTLRIGLPQLEQGAFATSPIKTTTAAATHLS